MTAWEAGTRTTGATPRHLSAVPVLILRCGLTLLPGNEAVHLLYRGLLALIDGVDIAVHCGLEVGVAQDVLDGLDVLGGVIEQRAERVTEYVCGCPVQVNRLSDASEHVIIYRTRNGFLPAPVTDADDDVA